MSATSEKKRCCQEWEKKKKIVTFWTIQIQQAGGYIM